jgi:hypothetical protein
MLTYYRLQHTQARFDPRVQGEWSITDETQSEFCLVLYQGVGVKVDAYTDGQKALWEFLSGSGFYWLDQQEGLTRETVEAALRRAGIAPVEVAA